MANLFSWGKSKPKPALEAPKKTFQDGWENVFTGLNRLDRDKTTGLVPTPDWFTPDQCDAIYNASDISARAVDMLANEMTRCDFDIKIEAGKDLSERVEKRHKELQTLKVFNKAHKLARKHGGAGIFLGVQERDKNTNLRRPLELKNVERMDYMTVFSSSELRPVEWYSNPFEKHFGMPKLYEVVPKAHELKYNADRFKYVHESRIIRCEGTDYFRNETNQPILSGWPGSIYNRLFVVIRQFETAWGSSTAIMDDFAQAVFKIYGLADAVATDKNNYIYKRYLALDMFRSSRKAILLDNEKETFERTNSQVNGLADMLEQFALRLASALRMPAALLMGQSPSGLNSTGASEIRWWFDQVAAERKIHVQPGVEFVTECIFQEFGKVPENWSLKWQPLWQPTDKEIADVRQQIAQADSQYLAAGVVSPEEIAKDRFGGDDFSLDTHINFESRMDMRGEPSDAELSELSVDVRPELNPEYFDKITAVILQVSGGKISRESGIAILEKFFKVEKEDAEELLGPELQVAPAASADVSNQFDPTARNSGVDPVGAVSDDSKPSTALQADKQDKAYGKDDAGI